MAKNDIKRTSVITNDIPDGIDKLNIDGYFRALKSYIMECDPPTTISIQGDWGTGKTTAIRNIEQKLKEESKVKSICLDVWPYSSLEHGGPVIGEIIQDLTDLLIEHNVIKQDQINKLKQTALVCASIAMKLLIAGGSNAILGSVMGSDGATAQTTIDTKDSEGIKELKESISKIKRFRDTLEESIKDSEIERLVVFVDDLDRLNSRLALEILEALKNFIDCKYCVFVLAIDSEIVSQGVKEKYGHDFSEDKAQKFFDKIIQLQFHLPVAAYDVENYLKRMFLINGESDDLVQRYSYAIQELMKSNPRNIKRTFNLLSLYEKLINEQESPLLEKWETNRFYLFVILAVQLYNNQLYQDLVKNANDNKSIMDYISEKDYKEIADRDTEDNHNKNLRGNDRQNVDDSIENYIDTLSDVLELNDDSNVKEVDETLRALAVLSGSKKTDELKIGKYVRHQLKELIEDDLIDKRVLKDLLDKEWSNNTFKLGPRFSFLHRDPNKDEETRGHYYATSYEIAGKEYYLCLEWKEDKRDFLNAWIDSLRKRDASK